VRPTGFSTVALIALCAVVSVPALVLLADRALRSADGALLDLQSVPPDGPGLLVTRLPSAGSPLRDGDLLIAIDGQPVEELLVKRSTMEVQRQAGAIRYLVIRDSKQLELTGQLTRRSLIPSLVTNWSSQLFLVYLIGIAIFVFVHRLDLPSARVLLWMACLMLGSGLAFFLGLRPVDLIRGWPYAVFLLAAIPLFGLAMAAVVHFSLVFPRKRGFLVRRRWAVPALYLGPWGPYLLLLVSGWAAGGTNSERLLLALRLSGVFTLALPALAMAIVIHGYVRHFDSKERRQTRWLVWGGIAVLLPWFTLSVLPSLLGGEPAVPQSAVGLMWLILPTAFAVAILRENMFDIDLIINRTLVYAMLTLTLAALYFAGVTLLQSLFQAVTDQQSPLAVVISTLVIAAIFNPLRAQIQTVIDRRFYRSRYDAARALSEFAVQIRDEVDLQRMQVMVLDTVRETMQPSSLSLWVRES